MATMTINILNPVIDLFRNHKTTSDSCRTTFEFDIQGSPNGQLKIDLTRIGGTVEDYEKAEVNLNGQWVTSNYPTQTHTLASSGAAKFRLIIGNADLITIKEGEGKCNDTEIRITDLTSGKSESKNFSRCREGAQCGGGAEQPTSTPTINSSTNIILYFDKSGSMDTTLAPLQTMRDTLLKDALLPYYNNDESVYNNKVKIIEVATKTATAYEDPYGMLNYENKALAGKVISLAFMDESDAFAPSGLLITDAPTPDHNSSLATLRNRLSNFPSNYYQGVLFQVATPDQGGDMITFRNYIEAVKNGTGSYSGTNGLSDKSEVNIKLDIIPASTAQYYKDLIIASLNELGYTL